MEGLIAAASEVIAATVQSALATEVYISESGRLARWACKLGLLLTELQLCLRSSEALRGTAGTGRSLTACRAAHASGPAVGGGRRAAGAPRVCLDSPTAPCLPMPQAAKRCSLQWTPLWARFGRRSSWWRR